MGFAVYNASIGESANNIPVDCYVSKEHIEQTIIPYSFRPDMTGLNNGECYHFGYVIILSLLLITNIDSAYASYDYTANITPVVQAKTLWCWAATAEMAGKKEEHLIF